MSVHSVCVYLGLVWLCSSGSVGRREVSGEQPEVVPPLAHVGPFGCLLPTFSLSEQFRYKRRVYAQNLIDDKQFAKLHTKVKRHPWRGLPMTTVPILAWPSLISLKWVSGPGLGLGTGSIPMTGPVIGGSLIRFQRV